MNVSERHLRNAPDLLSPDLLESGGRKGPLLGAEKPHVYVCPVPDRLTPRVPRVRRTAVWRLPNDAVDGLNEWRRARRPLRLQSFAGVLGGQPELFSHLTRALDRGAFRHLEVGDDVVAFHFGKKLDSNQSRWHERTG